MAKGKPSPKITKGAKGRKNHGPKRHLHHDITPKALRMSMASHGVLTKYSDFDSFCVALQDRKVRADYKMMWEAFQAIPMIRLPNDDMIPNRAAQDDFFAHAVEIGQQMTKAAKKGNK